MVDINLFDDDEEKSSKREKEWNSTPEKKDEHKEDPLKDELSLDDDFGGSSALGDETLLGEDDVVPELEDAGGKGKEDSYIHGDVKKKKTPAYYYIILAAVVLLAIAYVYFVVLAKSGPGRSAKSVKTKKTSVAVRVPSSQQPTTLPGVTSPAGTRGGPSITDTGKSALPLSGKSVNIIDITRSVFDDLSKQEQFGAVLLDGERFAVEYVSITPGVSQQMGQRIKQLVAAADFKASPEERHSVRGKTTYWGVISGILGKKPSAEMPISSTQFSSSDQFINQVKALAKQNNLTSIDVKKQFGEEVLEKHQSGYRIRVEGSRVQTMTWLEQLKKYQPSCNFRTLFLVPMDYFDRGAENIKMVLDLSVRIG